MFVFCFTSVTAPKLSKLNKYHLRKENVSVTTADSVEGCRSMDDTGLTRPNRENRHLCSYLTPDHHHEHCRNVQRKCRGDMEGDGVDSTISNIHVKEIYQSGILYSSPS